MGTTATADQWAPLLLLLTGGKPGPSNLFKAPVHG